MHGLRVIGAGFGRTGTLSLRKALDDLSFGPTYHGEEILGHWSHVALWHRFATTGTTDWDTLFAGYGAGVDFPISCAYRQLADHYPEAKVVLSVRDPYKWWDSMMATVYPARTMLPAWVPKVVRPTREYLEMTDILIWDGLFDERFEDRDHAVKVFEAHTAEVKASIPADRLLVFDVAEGWEPLCAFLDVPEPDTPFPRLNDTARMQRLITSTRIGSRVVPPALVGAAAYGAWRALAR
ncbi:MAG TPA: sulfotransferase [Acidimicrobiales bacterium]|nr:sulfotransferase [Acidimicrobiales bacterium]